jgi:hypothetical protein
MHDLITGSCELLKTLMEVMKCLSLEHCTEGERDIHRFKGCNKCRGSEGLKNQDPQSFGEQTCRTLNFPCRGVLEFYVSWTIFQQPVCRKLSVVVWT